MTIKGSHVSVLFHCADMIPGEINSLQSKYCDDAVFLPGEDLTSGIASDADLWADSQPQMSSPPILQEVPPEDMSGQSECQLHPQFVENFELNAPDHCGEIMLHELPGSSGLTNWGTTVNVTSGNDLCWKPYVYCLDICVCLADEHTVTLYSVPSTSTLHVPKKCKRFYKNFKMTMK